MVAPRALNFGTVAATYERYRPDYPDALFDVVRSYAGGPLETALEIGAGTGKATRVFAARGVAVTATDPDLSMLAELGRVLPRGVTTSVGALEELALRQRFPLVYAAAALHWTRPEGRWQRIAALLEPDGVFASIGGPARLADQRVADAVTAARLPYLADDDIPSPDGTDAGAPMQWPGTELERSALFTDVRQVDLERRLTMTADAYVGHLSTVSAYLELDDATRAAALRAIRGALPDTVDLDADLVIHLARRAEVS